MATAGMLLAAGAGRRMGVPKALLHQPDGTPWVRAAADVLRSGGCAPVLVVVGARAEEVEALLGTGAVAVQSPGWEEGMGASLRAGLEALTRIAPAPDAVVVGLVDTPGVTGDVVERLLEHASPTALARATYDGSPAHPVLLGRDHWAGVRAVSAGDAGARDYLAEHTDRVLLVECGDVGSGEDVDVPRIGSPARPPLRA
jgi:CTP:molybdopterin cytidylyltransferase MocA